MTSGHVKEKHEGAARDCHTLSYLGVHRHTQVFLIFWAASQTEYFFPLMHTTAALTKYVLLHAECVQLGYTPS